MSQNKNDAKRKKRQERLNKNRVVEKSKLQYSNKYPSLEINVVKNNPIDASFVSEIGRVIRTINFNDKVEFKNWHRQFYQYVKSLGVRGTEDLFSLIEKSIKSDNEEIHVKAIMEIARLIGTIIFKRLNPQFIKFFPYNLITAVPVENRISVQIRCLCKKKSKYGTIYYSEHNPKVIINGEKKIVGFSRHAIERILARSFYETSNMYVHFTETSKLLIHNKFYEVIKVSGQEFISFYDAGYEILQSSKNVDSAEDIARVVLGKSFDDHLQYYYRIGYMPLGIVDEFASGTTLLTPGMRGTPEYELLKSSNLSYRERETIEEKINNHPGSICRINIEDNLSILKWFHDNGIPQVVQLDNDPFV